MLNRNSFFLSLSQSPACLCSPTGHHIPTPSLGGHGRRHWALARLEHVCIAEAARSWSGTRGCPRQSNALGHIVLRDIQRRQHSRCGSGSSIVTAAATLQAECRGGKDPATVAASRHEGAPAWRSRGVRLAAAHLRWAQRSQIGSASSYRIFSF